jgi:hypothetical protein
MRTRTIVLGALAAVGAAIGIAWGWQALVVYTFLAAVAGGSAFVAGLGGDWMRDVSSRRFEDRR